MTAPVGRVNGRYATTVGGKPVHPSVTAVLGVLNKPGLSWGAARETALFAIHHRDQWESLAPDDAAERLRKHHRGVWDDKATRGSLVHDMALSWSKGEEVECPPDCGPYLDALERFYEDWLPRWVRCEETVVFDHPTLGYGGTFDAIADLLDSERWLLDIKRLALDTPLPTPGGWTTMGQTEPGDVLLDETGRPCTVTGVSQVRLDEDCYRITWEDGASVVAGAGHPWLVGSQAGDRIMSTLELQSRLARRQTKGLQRALWVNVSGAVDVPPRDLPIDPYVLGAWLGDGATRDGVMTAHRDDAGHLVAEFEDAGYFLKGERIDKRNSNCVSLNFPELRRRVIANGLANNKHVPAVYLRASRQQRLSLLQGLMDTDGSVNQARLFRATFVQKRPEVIAGFLDLVRGLGMRIGEGHLLESGARSFEFTPTLPVFRLPRKAGRIGPTNKQKAIARRRMILSVDRVPSVPTKCVAVDSPSHLYLCTEHYVPTHNTGSAVYPETALQLAAYRHAEHIAVFSPLGGIQALEPNVEVDRCGIVHLHDDGTYDLVPVVAERREWDWFIDCRRLYDFTSDKVAKAVLGKPLRPKRLEAEA